MGWNVLDNPGVILLGRMALIALLIGTSLSAAATGRVDLWLVLSASLAWSFVPLLQLLTGVVLVRGTAVALRRALEAYFATHWPWSLWIIAVHGAFVAIPAARDLALWLLLTAVLPIGATVLLLHRLCTSELAMKTAQSRRRVALHQALTIAIAIVYLGITGSLVPRVLDVLR